ncbi:MAG: MFS transporter, partial [Clostridia bacterium]|nr:MFS transporter [Clostridia bacterium]
LNAFLDMLISLSVAAFGLIMGAMGEVMDYRLCISISACVTCLTCWATIWRKRKHVRAIYQREVQ